MSTAIIHKKTAVSGRSPQVSAIEYGELALNTVDGAIYFKINDGTDRVIDATKDRFIFDVVASGTAAYNFSGVGLSTDPNPTLRLQRGVTYEFHVDAAGHPFRINTANTTGTGSEYSDGVTNNGAETGIVTFTVPMDAPSILYYNCEVHSSMNGTIYVLSEDSDTLDGQEGSYYLDYTNFTNTPTIPADVGDLTDTGGLLFSGDYDDLTNKPTIPTDVGDLTDTGGLFFSGSYTDLTNKPTIPADVSDLTDTTGLLVSSIDDLSDVDTTTSAPTTGQVLKWDGSKWAPANDITEGGAGLDADTLDGQDGSYYLNYNNFTNTPTIPADVSDLTDTTSLLFSGDYNDLTNKPTVPTSVDDLTDVDISTTAPTTGQVLKWDGAKFIPADESGGTGGGGTTYVEMSIQSDTYTGDGSTTDFTIAQLVNNDDYVLAIINGVVQDPSEYSVSGTTVTFTTAPLLDDNVELRSFKASSTDVELRDYKVYKYTIASDTSSVTGSDDNAETLTYDAGFIEVYVNGIRLAAGDDYGAINGTSVSFNETVFAGSVVEVVSLSKTTLFGGLAPIDSDQVTISDTSETTVSTFSATAFRTAKYIVQMTRSTSYHSAEVLLIHDGVNVYTTEYASIYTTTALGTIDARIVSGNIELTVTPTTANTAVRTKRLSVEV